MEQYSEKVIDHFYKPRNVGEIVNPDGLGQVGNMKCGDVMSVYIKVGRRPVRIQDIGLGSQESPSPKSQVPSPEFEEFIEEIKFKTLGCAAAIASSSMMTELAKGKSLDEALALSRDDINEALGILPKQKYHCSILSADAIHRAIEDYKGRQSGASQESGVNS